MRQFNVWTAEEDEAVMRGYKWGGYKGACEGCPNRSESAVQQRVSLLRNRGHVIERDGSEKPVAAPPAVARGFAVGVHVAQPIEPPIEPDRPGCFGIIVHRRPEPPPPPPPKIVEAVEPPRSRDRDEEGRPSPLYAADYAQTAAGVRQRLTLDGDAVVERRVSEEILKPSHAEFREYIRRRTLHDFEVIAREIGVHPLFVMRVVQFYARHNFSGVSAATAAANLYAARKPSD